MFKRTLKGIVDDLTIEIPSMISELSVLKAIQIQELEGTMCNDLDIIEILAGLPKKTLCNNLCQLDDISVFTLPVTNLMSQLRHNYDHELIPDEVTFKIPLEPHEIKPRWFGRVSPTHRDLTVKVPRRLTIEPAGALMNAKEIIKEAQENHIKLYGEDSEVKFQPPVSFSSRVIAHYFYCKVYPGPYDEWKAEAFTDIVNQLPVTQAFPLACFFFLNSETLSGTRPGVWARALQYSRKKREYKALRNSHT